MRILKNRALEARWDELKWDRALASAVLPPQLSALVAGPLEVLTGAVDIGEHVEPASRVDADALLLVAVKAAFVLAARLEPQGAFRVLVRRHDGPAGSSSSTVTLRCFRRDDSHPRTPDELDEPASTDCILFVDTRRIDGARRA